MTAATPPPPGPEGPDADAGTTQLGGLTVEDDLSTDPTERGIDSSGGGDQHGGPADDLQADEAQDPSS